MPKFLTIKGMTSPGTTYDFITRWFIDSVRKDYSGTEIRHIPGGSADAALRIQAGEAQFGVTVPGSAYYAAAGVVDFDKPQTRAVTLSNVPNPHQPGFVTLASSSINGIKDFGNKKIHVGLATFTTVKTGIPYIFSLYGITYDSIAKNGGKIYYGNTGDAVDLMAAGELDAVWQIGAHPYAPLTALDLTKGIKFIGYTKEELAAFCDPVKGTPGYVPITLPVGFYKSVTQPVQLAGTWSALTVDKNLPDDVVFNILVSLWRDKRYTVMEDLSPSWKGADWEKNAYAMAGGPWHPGAIKFFKAWGKEPSLPLSEGGKPPKWSLRGIEKLEGDGLCSFALTP